MILQYLILSISLNQMLCELLLATSTVNNTGTFHYGGQHVQVFKKTAEENKSVQKTSEEKQ